jgi:hypothetical protein
MIKDTTVVSYDLYVRKNKSGWLTVEIPELNIVYSCKDKKDIQHRAKAMIKAFNHYAKQ